MRHEDGYCDACGADIQDRDQWLRFDGTVTCEECARGEMYQAHRVASKPEARDDGR